EGSCAVASGDATRAKPPRRCQRGARRRLVVAAAAPRHRSSMMVGRSRAMRELCDQIDKIARSPASVLVVGESGVGKELVARAIHERSARAAGPFVVINCGALAAPLLESELFGHLRGAFSGALERRRGLFEAAHGGTLLLDEIGELA